ncbi:hypothetical protein L5515_017125 [Caenorhabditis briggsae]|uniref:Protein kinase domain-containing protein n=1 Tax=Caenorhabditis briggsae TaxID=6238 RepID=A0AAE9JR53_CAEBR|nr:hypothetical protein L5515_017125 [Caenorhabditis briggsae]
MECVSHHKRHSSTLFRNTHVSLSRLIGKYFFITFCCSVYTHHFLPFPAMRRYNNLVLIFCLFCIFPEVNANVFKKLAASFSDDTKFKLPPERCIVIRLKHIPVSLNKTENGENYLNSEVNDKLELKFTRACDRDIKCVIYYNNGSPSSHLTTDSSDTNVQIRSEHSSLKCIQPTGEFLKFHIFVQESNTFFKNAEMIETNSTLQLRCLGGAYTKNVKLKKNGENLETAYSPFLGFILDRNQHSSKSFYQCEYENEMISFNYPGSAEVDGFQMQTHKFQTLISIYCNANEDFLKDNNTRVIIACPYKEECSQPSTDRKGYIHFPISQIRHPSDLNSFSCVFLKNDEIEAIAFDRNGEHEVTITIFIVLGFGSIGTLLIYLLNLFARWNENKRKVQGKFSDEDLLISKDVRDLEKIAEGHSSKILLTSYKPNGRKVVIKCSKNASQCEKELMILKNLRHVNIIDPLGYVRLDSNGRFFKKRIKNMVLPYYPNTCLEQYIKQFFPVTLIEEKFHGKDKSGKELKITLFDMISIGWQVARALEYLKGKGFTHRDVAMRNVLITDDLICKLTDFERSRKGEIGKRSVARKIYNHFAMKNKTIPTMYPAECEDGAFYYSSDVYCFGLLLLEMFQFTKPIVPGNFSKPMHCPDNIYEIIRDCIKVDREHRINIVKCESQLETALKEIDDTKLLNLKTKLIKEGSKNIWTEWEETKPNNVDPYKELDSSLFSPIM